MNLPFLYTTQHQSKYTLVKYTLQLLMIQNNSKLYSDQLSFKKVVIILKIKIYSADGAI